MGRIDLLLLSVFALMGLAVVIDRAWAGAQPPAEPAPSALTTRPEAEVLGFPELGAHAQGWALMGPTGTLVATNVPARAPLLAAACAVLRLAGDSGGDPALPPWQTVTLEGGSGLVLGEMSARGAILAVLAAPATDRGVLRAAMAEALAEVERRWDEVVPPPAEPLPPPDRLPAAIADAASPTPYTPLD